MLVQILLQIFWAIILIRLPSIFYRLMDKNITLTVFDWSIVGLFNSIKRPSRFMQCRVKVRIDRIHQVRLYLESDFAGLVN